MVVGVQNHDEFLPGWVWLVGAGPGDPGLMTVAGAHALVHADVVVYDALVDAGILRLAGPDVVLEYAGKRGGKPSAKQRDISLRLVQLANQGKRVLRLKGGDPFVFGRGGEEALVLVEHNIPFRVVPGVTAGVGGLAYAGIPSTHRDLTHTVTFLTGHNSSGQVPDQINWQAVAKGSPVIVMYMALKHWDTIRGKLIEAGRSAEEPVAFICDATTDRQQVHVGDLATDRATLEGAGIAPPAIIVVGEVVRLRASLDWLGAIAAGIPATDKKLDGSSGVLG